MRAPHWAKRFLTTLSGIVMVLAMLMFGMAPDTVAAHAAATPAAPLPPGTVVHAASCEQAPAQSAKDRATYSSAELARYGLPPRTPGEPFEKWAKIVRNAGERVCDYTIGTPLTTTVATPSATMEQSIIWAGNVADESSPGQNYTEADMDYYIPCISGIPPNNDEAGMATWIGLGGNNSTRDMIQVGVRAVETSGINIYQVFVENTSTRDGNDTRPQIIFGLSCGQHVYVKVWNHNCMYLQWLGNGKNTGNKCFGPYNDGLSAQAIAERSTQEPYFANFGAVTFYGVGITDNGSYLGMNQVPHHYDQVYDCQQWLVIGYLCNTYRSTPLATVGPIQNDPGNPPYDKYAVTWKGYGSPWPS